jgi:hypothetical protein
VDAEGATRARLHHGLGREEALDALGRRPAVSGNPPASFP